MTLFKQPWSWAWIVLAVVAIVAAGVGESTKTPWVNDWLAPTLMLMFFIALSVNFSEPPRTVSTRKAKVVWLARTAAFAGLIWLYVSIDIVSDAPVTLRLMGASWTMGPQLAARFLEIGGLVIGAIAVALVLKDAQRTNAAPRSIAG